MPDKRIESRRSGPLRFCQRLLRKSKGSDPLVGRCSANFGDRGLCNERHASSFLNNGVFVQEISKSRGRESPVARPANMNHTSAADRQHDSNVNQVEEMETQDGQYNRLFFHCYPTISIWHVNDVSSSLFIILMHLYYSVANDGINVIVGVESIVLYHLLVLDIRQGSFCRNWTWNVNIYTVLNLKHSSYMIRIYSSMSFV